MDWIVAAALGVAGGASLEALDLLKAVRGHRKMPWNVRPDTLTQPRPQPDIRPGEENLPPPGKIAYCLAGLARLFISGSLAATIAASFPDNTLPLSYYFIGIGAVATVERALAFVPLLVSNLARATLNSTNAHAGNQLPPPTSWQPTSPESGYPAQAPDPQAAIGITEQEPSSGGGTG